MAMEDPEKQAMAADSEKSSPTESSHDTLASNNHDIDLEKQDGLLRPGTQSIGAQLTPAVSRKSKAASHLSHSRSYVDGHGHYSRHEDDLDEPENRDDNAEEKDYIEVKWDGDEDPLNPRNMRTWRKWVVVFTLAFGSLCVTCVSSLYTTTYDQIDVEFHVSTLVSTLGLATFVWGLGLAPMVLGPLSEFYGRRPVYICAYFFFTIWLIPCGKRILNHPIARTSPLTVC